MRLIRKQKNRRLYDTVARRNVTLAELATLIGQGESVQVEDGTSGEDITRGVLLQIVIEQDACGGAFLSQAFLESLIRLASNPMQQMAAGYLEASVATFERYQHELAERWQPNATAAADPTQQTAVLAEMARESLKGWMSLQRAFFDAWQMPADADTKHKD